MRDPRILVIERDEALVVRVTAALEGAGFNVVTATNALHGLMKTYESHPDVIIMATEILVAGWEDSYLQIRLATYLPIIVLGNSEEAAEMLENKFKTTSIADLLNVPETQKPLCHFPAVGVQQAPEPDAQ